MTRPLTIELLLESSRDVTAVDEAIRRGDPASVVFHDAAMRRVERMVREKRGEHRHVVVACMPKSASTYLNAVLVNATGFRSYLLNPLGDDTERDILLTALPMFLAQPTVSQEHMKATRRNVELLRRLEIRPVVLVRNIFDAIVSARDHQVREGGVGPAAHVPKAYVRWSSAEQLSFNVSMATPWLLSFYASWCDAARELPVLWVTYEEVTRDTVSTVGRILKHCEVEVEAGRIEAAVAAVGRRGVRFNRGEVGRGRRELSADQIEWVRQIAAPFRDEYDLRPIGL